MRYDMKYKKLNVEDNESCNLQCEKKCEKLAGVFICCILAFFLLFLLFQAQSHCFVPNLFRLSYAEVLSILFIIHHFTTSSPIFARLLVKYVISM